MGPPHRWFLQAFIPFPTAILTFLSPRVIPSFSLQSMGETGPGELTSSPSRPPVIFLLGAEATPLFPLCVLAASTAELRR